MLVFFKDIIHSEYLEYLAEYLGSDEKPEYLEQYLGSNNIWGQMKNYFIFGLGPLRNIVTRRPDSCSISCLNLSFPNAIP